MSKSPERGTFQWEQYKARAARDGDPKSVADMIKVYESYRDKLQNESMTEEQKENNLEYDLRSTDWILEKVRVSDTYAQNLYAAMCNRDFQKIDVWPILKGEKWHCSWRYAGGIIADMREQGDYIDWYCSGIRNYPEGLADGEPDPCQGYVPEATVTIEIAEDLKKLGWNVLPETR